ncbi:MAG: hypothetical protein J0L55_10095 [Caulobacterales bacterium]|nr:hypothetical protein [Caulobacterales bacterium]MCA0371655.1 hypothetical protein [Pseudomonadota bacterium]
MKGFRTLSVATLITLLGFLQQAQLVNLIPENYRGIFISIIGLAMAFLRLKTNTKIFNAQ